MYHNMKKILIYEYFTGGGLLNEDLSSDLMLEARMMLSTLILRGKREELNNNPDSD